MAKKIIVTVSGKKYKINKTKESELKKWLEDNAETEAEAQTSEDLIIDIEETAGAEIEYNEFEQEEEKKEKDNPK